MVATALYGTNKKAFMDLQIIHASVPSNMAVPIRNEDEKKYSSRMIKRNKFFRETNLMFWFIYTIKYTIQ